MPSGKHNSRMARVRDLIFSLINIASSRDVPFHQSQQLQCLDQGATFVPHWSLIHSSQLCKVTIYIMASVQGIKIAEGLLTLCLAYYVRMLWNKFNICWNWIIIAFTYQDMWHMFREHIFHIFCNGWMDCRDAFYVVFCLYCCVTDRHSWARSVLAYGFSNN